MYVPGAIQPSIAMIAGNRRRRGGNARQLAAARCGEGGRGLVVSHRRFALPPLPFSVA
jgi:hypothetical protein